MTRMAFMDCQFFSETLGLSVSLYALLPQPTSGRQIGLRGRGAARRHPALLLLHGLSDDHTIWMRRTAIERYAAEKGLAVIMPAAGRSYYQDMASGPRYWTFISEEVPRVARAFFPLSAARRDNFVAGLSMGGYGAFRVALAHPDRYAAAASLSGVMDLPARYRRAAREETPFERAEMDSIFGRSPRLAGGKRRAGRSWLRPALAKTASGRSRHVHVDSFHRGQRARRCRRGRLVQQRVQDRPAPQEGLLALRRVPLRHACAVAEYSPRPRHAGLAADRQDRTLPLAPGFAFQTG